MPIYEYQCQKCGHEFEREQRIVEDPIKTCPACKSQKAKRLISNTSFVLKGSGWYKDLYSSAGAGGKKDDAAGESKSESKTETKSDAKKDSGSGTKSDSGKAKGAKKSAA